MSNFYKDTDIALETLQNTSNGVLDAATGTGKGVIIANDASKILNERPVPQLTVVVGHRILLTAQLQERIINASLKQYSSVPFKRIGVGSGDGESIETETLEDKIALQEYPDEMCTTSDAIEKSITEAHKLGHNISIYATYHSLWKVVVACAKVGLRPRVYADEIHVPAGDKSKWEQVEELVNLSDEYYAFTATLDRYRDKVESVFGKTIYKLSAADAIQKGLICKPVWMIADVEGERESNVAQGVAQAFREHNDNNSYDVKALVNCNGKADVESIMWSKQLVELKNDFPTLMVAVISSDTGCIIDGNKVSRPEWIKTVIAHNGALLVLHIDICNAGIDIPEFNLVVWSYLPGSETYHTQGNGRGSRLSEQDRKRLESGEITTADRSTWHKPYNTVCMLTFTDITEEDKDEFVDFIVRSREQGFEMNDTIVAKRNGGKKDPFGGGSGTGGSWQDINKKVKIALESEAQREARIKIMKMNNPADVLDAI